MKAFNRLISPLKRAIINMMVKGVVTMVDDAGDLQRVQARLLGGTPHDGIEHYQPYGLAYCPKPGALGLFLALGGNRSHTVAAVVADPRYRPKDLESGEVALYTDEGDTIFFRRGRIIEITAGAKVKVAAPEIEAIADTKAKVQAPDIDLIGAVNITGSAMVNGHAVLVAP
jgi:phage baseplate assembly protein V